MRNKYKNYDELPYQQQAVGLSLLHNFGDSSLDFGTMKSVMGGDLKSGIDRLRNADEWKNPELFARRNREADLLQSLIQPQQQQRGLMQ
jgi:GH24 family phage-related lysozyme (muramidase)